MQNGNPTIASLDDVAFERPPSLIDDLDGLTRMRSRSGDRDAADATFAVERFPVDEAGARAVGFMLEINRFPGWPRPRPGRRLLPSSTC